MIELNKKSPIHLVVARFPGRSTEHHEIATWLGRQAMHWGKDERIKTVSWVTLCDTPITMTRNMSVAYARDKKADLMMFIDDDMVPDVEMSESIKAFNAASPFWDSSFNFWWNHDGPCIIAAPYCGAPPEEVVHVFFWKQHAKDDYSLSKFSREAAITQSGIQRAAALATGLMLIDMRVFDKLTPPYFYYEWKDKTETEKTATEDVTFTRDASFAGVPLYCNWDAWAGHRKTVTVRRPHEINLHTVSRKWQQAILSKERNGEKIELPQRLRAENSYPNLPPTETEASWE